MLPEHVSIDNCKKKNYTILAWVYGDSGSNLSFLGEVRTLWGPDVWQTMKNVMKGQHWAYDALQFTGKPQLTDTRDIDTWTLSSLWGRFAHCKKEVSATNYILLTCAISASQCAFRVWAVNKYLQKGRGLTVMQMDSKKKKINHIKKISNSWAKHPP